MGLAFKYQKNFENKEKLAEKIAEAFRCNGYDAVESYDGIAVKGVKSCFNVGSATIKIDGSTAKVEGKIMPSIAAMICAALSLIFDIIGLCVGGTTETVLLLALVIALGAAGTIGTIITFFLGGKLVRQEVALMVNSAGK